MYIYIYLLYLYIIYIYTYLYVYIYIHIFWNTCSSHFILFLPLKQTTAYCRSSKGGHTTRRWIFSSTGVLLWLGHGVTSGGNMIYNMLEALFPACVAGVPASLWGSGEWANIRCLYVRNRSQPFATVRNRSQPFPTVRVEGRMCLWQVPQQRSLLNVSHVAWPRFARQVWYFVTFQNVSWRVELFFVANEMSVLMVQHVSSRFSCFLPASPCLWGNLPNVSLSKVCLKLQSVKVEEISHEMWALMFRHVLSGASGFPPPSPCNEGSCKEISPSKVSKQLVMWFWKAGVALADALMCLQTCRKSFCVAGHYFCFLFRRWGALHSTLCSPHCRLDMLHFALHTLRSTLHTAHFTLYTSHGTLYALHFTLYALHSALYTPHLKNSKLHTGHSTLCTLRFIILHTLHSTLGTLHFAHHTLYFTRYTLHSILHTLRSTLHTVHFTLYTSHFTLYTPHFTLHTLHSTLKKTLNSTRDTPHCALYALQYSTL